MYILSVHWDLLALWRLLSLTAKLYLSCLSAAVVYTSYVLLRSLAHLHDLRKKSAPVEAESGNASLLGITRAIEERPSAPFVALVSLWDDPRERSVRHAPGDQGVCCLTLCSGNRRIRPLRRVRLLCVWSACHRSCPSMDGLGPAAKKPLRVSAALSG